MKERKDRKAREWSFYCFRDPSPSVARGRHAAAVCRTKPASETGSIATSLSGTAVVIPTPSAVALLG